MCIQFFTHKANSIEHNKVLVRLIALLEQEVQLYNIPQHRPETIVKDNSVIVSFGKFANSLVDQAITEKQLTNIHHAKLVHPEFLLPLTKNQHHRAAASEKLHEIKDIIREERFHPTGLTVTAKDLPDLQAMQLLLLKKLTDEEGKSSCFQTTKNGKTIEIGINPRQDSKADIFLTFEEIYTVRSIMDILKVEDVKLCPVENQK